MREINIISPKNGKDLGLSHYRMYINAVGRDDPMTIALGQMGGGPEYVIADEKVNSLILALVKGFATPFDEEETKFCGGFYVEEEGDTQLIRLWDPTKFYCDYSTFVTIVSKDFADELGLITYLIHEFPDTQIKEL